VLTIGSTGAMAGGQCGTAVSAIIAAHHAGRGIHAVVAETRPGFDGSRIAAWELRQAGVTCSLVTDAAAPARVAAGDVGAVVVGADRVAANGDVVATAGTYAIALAASAAGVPFLVCAPTIAVDLEAPDGRGFTLEGPCRAVLVAAGTRVAPQGTLVDSPAQDLTPATLVTAIVTDAGVVRPPFGPGLATQRVAG
jgi:methylthioribose-1-phosphate isomerase